MADEKTQTVHARLIKGFSAPQHRRAGHVFTPGPEYQAVEVTKEGLAALQDDPSIEIAKSQSEAEKVNSQYQPKSNLSEAEREGSTDAQQDPDNVSGEKDTGATHARRYSPDDASRSGSPEAGFNAPQPPQESAEGDESKADDVLMSLSRTDLNKTAVQEGVDSPEKLANKQEVVEAIMERRNAGNGSDAADSNTTADPDAGKPEPTDNGTDNAPASDTPNPATQTPNVNTPDALDKASNADDKAKTDTASDNKED